ncbi:STAS domain-containing protein [Actinokineospora alba]|uniref:STAS domain-containing protein n=1 Tax=Actinokineospora alba TaxID=504798 RepID=A0A1H0UWS6_9PSEU|nr:STAS domain-containing protein [Actinokineospora alba]SDI77575.1 STAS domain-containing protein [Actinokineospora alba]SDP70515.1 STAS domain-containing protein [Actinokineospora alba]
MAAITDLFPLSEPNPDGHDSDADGAHGTRVSGHADLSTRPDFEEFLLALCRQAEGDVHLDFAELDFIDISGVITVVRAAGSLDEGRFLVLHNPPPSMRRILELLGPAAVARSVRIEEDVS